MWVGHNVHVIAAVLAPVAEWVAWPDQKGFTGHVVGVVTVIMVRCVRELRFVPVVLIVAGMRFWLATCTRHFVVTHILVFYWFVFVFVWFVFVAAFDMAWAAWRFVWSVFVRVFFAVFRYGFVEDGLISGLMAVAMVVAVLSLAGEWRRVRNILMGAGMAFLMIFVCTSSAVGTRVTRAVLYVLVFTRIVISFVYTAAAWVAPHWCDC